MARAVALVRGYAHHAKKEMNSNEYNQEKSLARGVTTSKSHGTIIPRKQVHSTIFITIFKQKNKYRVVEKCSQQQFNFERYNVQIKCCRCVILSVLFSFPIS